MEFLYIYIFVYCFSCRYLVELGLRQLGLPVPKFLKALVGGSIEIFILKPYGLIPLSRVACTH